MEEFLNDIQDIRFDTIIELYENKEKIKKGYQSLPLGYKQIYKWYFFYQLCILNYDLKNAMWEYLNMEKHNSDIILDLSYHYRRYLAKREKIINQIEEEKEKRRS